MLTVSQQQVVGALKATGSRDPDILFAAKEDTMTVQRQLKLVSLVGMFFGGALTVTLIGAPVGLPVLLAAYFVRRTVVRNLAAADATYRSFLDHAGVPGNAHDTADATGAAGAALAKTAPEAAGAPGAEGASAA